MSTLAMMDKWFGRTSVGSVHVQWDTMGPRQGDMRQQGGLAFALAGAAVRGKNNAKILLVDLFAVVFVVRVKPAQLHDGEGSFHQHVYL